MKRTHKTIALFLGLILCLSLTAPALAAQDDWYGDAAA